MYDFVHNFYPLGYFAYETKGVSTRFPHKARSMYEKTAKPVHKMPQNMNLCTTAKKEKNG